jgi:prepilin-type processing-associated H-X9-DG protein/prepilin-type N-terminal cleavage/methylation domain-containing protein
MVGQHGNLLRIGRLRDASPRPRRPGCGAFTLVELLVVLAVIAILAGLLLPGLSRSKESARSVACQNQLRQLQICFHLYALDHSGVMPPNNFVYNLETDEPDPVTFSTNQTWCPGNTRLDATTANIERGLLFPYNRSAAIYRCPSDRSKVETPEGRRRGLRRTRSYNLSQAINGEPYDGLLGEGYGPPSYARETDILQPPPSELFVFIDVHEDAILDSLFGIPPPGWDVDQMWWDVPADRHNRGCNLTFADGHVEHWRWKAPKDCDGPGKPLDGEKDRQDFRKLQSRVRPETRF